jgi:hypothetical protein
MRIAWRDVRTGSGSDRVGRPHPVATAPGSDRGLQMGIVAPSNLVREALSWLTKAV